MRGRGAGSPDKAWSLYSGPVTRGVPGLAQRAAKNSTHRLRNEHKRFKAISPFPHFNGSKAENLLNFPAFRGVGIVGKGFDVPKVLYLSYEDRKILEKFVSKRSLDLPIGIDRTKKSFAHFQVSTLPKAFVIDDNGFIVWEGHSGLLTESVISDFIRTGGISIHHNPVPVHNGNDLTYKIMVQRTDSSILNPYLAYQEASDSYKIPTKLLQAEHFLQSRRGNRMFSHRPTPDLNKEILLGFESEIISIESLNFLCKQLEKELNLLIHIKPDYARVWTLRLKQGTRSTKGVSKDLVQFLDISDGLFDGEKIDSANLSYFIERYFNEFVSNEVPTAIRFNLYDISIQSIEAFSQQLDKYGLELVKSYKDLIFVKATSR